jgi:CHAT domain-containing protein/uncharacterized protein HemY
MVWARETLRAVIKILLLALLTGQLSPSTSAISFSCAKTCPPIVAVAHGQGPAPHAVPLANPGQRIERTIRGGEIQTFRISLPATSCAQITFEWAGLDLGIVLLKPDGFPLFDSSFPVRGSGTPPLLIVTQTAEDYTLEVRPSEKINITGNYAVLLEDIRPATEKDRDCFAAEKLVATAENKQEPAAAIVQLTQALQIYGSLADLKGEACTLRRLARRYSSAKDFEKAKSTNEKSISLGRQLKDQRAVAYTLIDIGEDYKEYDSPANALTFYEQALAIFRQLGDRKGEATALYSLGYALGRIGKIREALQSYEPFLTISRVENDLLGQALALTAIGGANYVLGEEELALQAYQQAVPIWNQLNHKQGEAITRKNIALVYDDWGDWQSARDTYISSLAVFKSLLKGSYPSACQTQVLNENRTVCNSIANALDTLAELNNSLGEPQRAQEILQESLVIRRTLSQPQGLGATLSRIAYAYLLQEKPNDALTACEEALPYVKQATDLRKQASVLTFRGVARVALNQQLQAVEDFEQALKLHEETGNRRGLGITLDQMGRAFASSKKFAKAFEHYDRALAIWREVKDEDWETRTLYNIAKAERDRGEPGDLIHALAQIDRALQIVEHRRTTLNSKQLRISYFANKGDMYELFIDLKMQLRNAGAASDCVASAWEASERARARTLLDTLSEAHVDREVGAAGGATDPQLKKLVARRVLLTGRLHSLGERQANLLAGPPKPKEVSTTADEIKALTNEYDEVEAQLHSQDPHYAALVKPKPLTLSEIQGQLDADTSLVTFSLGEKRSYVWVVSSNSIQGVELPKREQIEGAVRQLSTALTARNRAEKNEAAVAFKNRIANADANTSEAAARLSEMVLGPIASLLGNKRLLIVADGALQVIPFPSLPVPAAAETSSTTAANTVASKNPVRANEPRLLLEDHEVINLPSASVLAVQRHELANRKPAPHAAAVIANPVFDPNDERVKDALRSGGKLGAAGKRRPQSNNVESPPVKPLVPDANAPAAASSDLSRALRDIGLGEIPPPLFFSFDEAEAIVKVAPKGETLAAINFDASRATAMSAELSKYRFIHIATHGIMDLEHPELSGLVLSLVDRQGKKQDGYLRLHDIYNLNLPAELVVLSACETGIGKQIKGEGLIALTRGFMYAGAKSVVASLWKVNDIATADLMAEFYRQMFVNNLKPAAALQKAQVKMSQSKRWHAPYYWAGFVITGDWK